MEIVLQPLISLLQIPYLNQYFLRFLQVKIRQILQFPLLLHLIILQIYNRIRVLVIEYQFALVDDRLLKKLFSVNPRALLELGEPHVVSEVVNEGEGVEGVVEVVLMVDCELDEVQEPLDVMLDVAELFELADNVLDITENLAYYQKAEAHDLQVVGELYQLDETVDGPVDLLLDLRGEEVPCGVQDYLYFVLGLVFTGKKGMVFVL